jgi:ubiquinone/menaquinone biosynthesis C-methylase UbiE
MESEEMEMATAAKAYKGMGMEGGIARWYDKTTRRDMPEFKKLAAKIASIVPAGGKVLEIAPGPGFLSIELAKRGLEVQAVDISRTFIEIVQKNAAAEDVKVEIQLGNAADLPVARGSVDFVVCRAAFKNFTEPVKAMKEMLRVLRPGGIALLIDMRRDVSVPALQRYVDSLGVNRLDAWFTMFSFKHMLIKRAYPMEEIERMAAEAGWVSPRIEAGPIGFEAWVTK